MTLPELLVVVAIIGLLAVTVLPILSNGREKSRAREAADLVIAHLNQTMANAMSSRSGAATWYETESSGAGGDLAVVTLAFGRPRPGVSGAASVIRSSTSVVTATMQLSPAVAAYVPAPLEFAGLPNRFTVVSVSPGSGVATISGTTILGNQNLYRTASNNIVPDSQTPMAYVLHLPPRLRMTSATSRVPNGMCIDLASSTIGVHGFTPPVSVIPLGSAQSASHRLSIVFDKTGRPEAVWYSPNHDDTTPLWQMHRLDASTPVALLVGVQANCGNGYVASPSDDNPGTNWQDPNARWVLVDPRTSIIKSIEVNPRATSIPESQDFVRRTLQNAAY